MSNITIFEHVLDNSLRQILLQESIELLKSGENVWKTNYSWNKGIVQTSQTVLARLYDKETSKKILTCLFDRGILDPQNQYNVMNYIWTHNSYIPWHNDNLTAQSMTIYLNDYWNIDWGGIFLWIDESGNIRGHFPAANTAVRNNSFAQHYVTPITSNADSFRYTVQIWKI